ncbi:hypothetical protein [Kitasatospora sp. NPDC056731]|uniref:hypothetical protein n=1 Tax=Kitasatospora sp. NPDC056731 TaxID=3155422 RepID=UPI003446ABDE
METSRFTGEDPHGHQHAVKVVSGRNNTRRVVCESCGYRRSAAFGAQAKASQHLSQTHEAGYVRQEFAPGPWIAAAVGLVAFIIFLCLYGI